MSKRRLLDFSDMSWSSFKREVKSRQVVVFICAIFVCQLLVLGACVRIIALAWSYDAAQLARLNVIGQAISNFGLSAATIGGLLTLLAAVAPRWLSELSLGPRLTVIWEKGNGGYVHEWNRRLSIDGQKLKCPAIIVRMAISNEGIVAAESVKAMVETIEVVTPAGSKEPDPLAKFSPLRWADSYDLEEFEKLKHHRCETTIEPLIHAGAMQFVDFGFIFAPDSPFYPNTMPNPEKLGTGYWCFHPFYQWLPAHGENAVLQPGGEYLVTLALSAKNSHKVKRLVRITCASREHLTSELFQTPFAVVGDFADEDSRCPIKIEILPSSVS